VDYQTLFNIAGGIAGFLGGWWMKVLHESVRDLQDADKRLADKVSSIEVLVAGNYVKRDDLDKSVDAIFRKLDRIEDKLDGKVDKREAH
jgi:hypothetical protein